MGMKYRRIKYISAFVIVLLIALFRIFLMLFSYWSIQLMNEKVEPALRTPPSVVFSFTYIFPILILFAEAIFYLLLRKRFFFRRLVRFHLWMTFVSSFLVPVIQYISYIVMPNYFSLNDLENAFKQFNHWGIIIGWILFAIARLFFIAAMVKSVTSLNEPQQENESTGLLDDFAQ
jgi:hypothetical protein